MARTVEGLLRRAGRGAVPPRGFTLLETSFALVVIGVGVLAFVEAHQAFIQNNSWSSRAATGTYLANEIREMMRRLPRHDPVTGLYFTGSGESAVLRGWGIETGEVDLTDFDDVDDFSGLVFGAAGTFEGPINAFGEVIPQTDVSGAVVIGSGGRPLPLRGWTQRVLVEKADPTNYGAGVGSAFFVPAGGGNPGRAVDRFPLRVTVVVEHMLDGALRAEEITRVTWVVPD
ncbi:MAG: prepilin-type N-terminal cleavage/methylation domain-containing protein [Phycisphaerae bacterium]|nr:prepilin-type N-terminal cleavage/methylation domain-containing protein [Phycisphaerae bacterium]